MRRMNPAPRRIDKRPLEMNPEHFGARCVAFVCALRLHPVSNSGRGPAGFASTGSHGRRDQRGGAVPRNRTGDGIQGLRCAFHHVVPARSMDVYVDKSRYNGQAACIVTSGFLRNCHLFTPTDSGDDAIFNQDYGIGDFFVRCKCAGGKNGAKRHCPGASYWKLRWECQRSSGLGLCQLEDWSRRRCGHQKKTGGLVRALPVIALLVCCVWKAVSCRM